MNWASVNSRNALKMDSAAPGSRDPRVNSTGLMGLTVSPDGPTLTTVASTVAVPFGAYDWGWLKTTWRASDGRVQFWTAPDAGSETEPTGGSWTQLGTDRTAAVGSIYDGTAPICFGSWSAALSNRPEGLFSRCILRSGIGGTVVADFRASSCSQTGYTDTVGTAGGAWTINRATAGRKSTLVTTRAIALHGTDDYCLLPKGAIPSALAAADASMAVAARPWATMGSNNQWLSFRAGTGIVPGMEIVTTSATAISSRTLDAVTYITPIPGTTVTMGQQAVATMTAAAGSPGPHLLRTNSAVTALVNRTGNDETGTTYGYVGSLAGSLQFIDYELSGVLTAQAALSAVDHGRLVAYYAGGS